MATNKPLVTMRPGTLDGHIIWENLVDHSYERAGVVFQADDVWLDAGGHIGCFALAAAPKVRQVFSYEPLTENQQLWHQNIKQNNISNATLVPSALTNLPVGFVPFHIHPEHAKGSLYLRAGQEPTVRRVRAVSLNLAIQQHQATAMKLDVEGAEVILLTSLGEEAWQRLRCIVCEYHSDVVSQSLQYVVKLLQRHYPIVRQYQPDKTATEGLVYAGRS